MLRYPFLIVLSLYLAVSLAYGYELPSQTQDFLDAHAGSRAIVLTVRTAPTVEKELVALYGAIFGSGNDPSDIAQDFIDNYADTLGVPGVTLVRDDAHSYTIRDGKFVVYAYQQWMGGFPSENTLVKIVVRRVSQDPPNYELNYVGIRGLQIPQSFATDQVSEAAAISSISTDPDYDHLTFTSATKVIFKAEDGNLHRAWRFSGFAGGDARVFYVDAASGDTKGIANLAQEDGISGTVQGYGTPGTSAAEASTLRSVPGVRVKLLNGNSPACPDDSGTVIDATLSDANGGYDFTGSLSYPVRAASRLVNDFVIVHDCATDVDPCDTQVLNEEDQAGSVACAIASQDGTGLDLTFNSGQDEDEEMAQVNAYLTYEAMREWVSARQPNSVDLNSVQLRIFANSPYASAFINTPYPKLDLTMSGQEVPGNFACESARNQATPTLTAHEIGHYVHYRIMGNIQLAGLGMPAARWSSFREGIADAFMALALNDPCNGRNLCDGRCTISIGTPCTSDGACTAQGDSCRAFCIRDVSAAPVQFPCFPSGAHQCGLSLAGSFWELRDLMNPHCSQTTGTACSVDSDCPGGEYCDDSNAENLLLDFMFISDAVLDQSVLLEVLIADDDDSNLLNGTPNSAAILEAFGNRGFINPICSDDVSGIDAEWIGPTGQFSEPVRPDDYVAYNVFEDGVCRGEVTLRTTVKGEEDVATWIVGRTESGNPSDIGRIRADWDGTVVNLNGTTVRIGDPQLTNVKARHANLVEIAAQGTSTQKWSGIRLELEGDLTGRAQPTAVSGAGGRVSGSVAGSVREIVAQAIGLEETTGTLLANSLGPTSASKVALQQHVSGSSLILQHSSNGEIVVNGTIAGSITIRGDMTGDICAGAIVSGSCVPSAAITGTVRITGLFNGDICGANFDDWPTEELPSNIEVTFGPNGTICGDEPCASPPSAVQAEPSPVKKSRFISMAPPNVFGGIRVELTSLHHVSPAYTGGPSTPFTAFEVGLDCDDSRGCVRWVGPPAQFVESSASGTPFYAALLQCEPNFQDWSSYDLLHVTGSAVVPSSSYSVNMVSQSDNVRCASSTGLTVETTRWADVETPFNPPSETVQPDLSDVAALVNKFRSAPGAISKARALLSGTDSTGNVDLTLDVSFTHISACVDAFRGVPYPHVIASCP